MDQSVEDDERADLAVYRAVLQLLADGTSGLCWAGSLEFDDFNELGDAAEVFLVICFAGEIFDGDGYRRVWFLLFRMSAKLRLRDSRQRKESAVAFAPYLVCRGCLPRAVSPLGRGVQGDVLVET